MNLNADWRKQFNKPAMASADSVQQGLAQSQVLTKKKDFNEYEDPGRAWIDLVLAFKASNPASVRAVLEQAKASHWTHDLYNEALIQAEEQDSDDEEWITDDEFPAQQEDFWEE